MAVLWNTHNTVFDSKRSMLKAGILNVTYDCYCENNNVKMATL